MRIVGVFSCGYGSPKPVPGCTELEFAAYGIDGYKQNQYLEQDEEKRLAQIDRVIHIRVIERMRTGFYRKKEGLHLFLSHSQRFCLDDDRG